MTLKTAIESFEQAVQVAESQNDSALEFIAHGLLDLTKALRTELNDIKRKVESVENKVRSLH
jgi:hypothetical protein